MMIIGITGQARNGKDEVANIINELYGYEIVSFSKPIKEAAMIMFGLTWDMVNEGDRDKVVCGGKSIRKLLQVVGTDWGRSLDENIWIDRLDEYIVRNRDKNFVIPDVRFNNEVLTTTKIIKVIRPGYEYEGNHESENGIDEDYVDTTIYNDGTIEELRRKVFEEVSRWV